MKITDQSKINAVCCNKAYEVEEGLFTVCSSGLHCLDMEKFKATENDCFYVIRVFKQKAGFSSAYDIYMLDNLEFDEYQLVERVMLSSRKEAFSYWTEKTLELNHF